MKEFLEQVKEFQIASGQPTSETPTLTTLSAGMLRYNLLKEENTEYIVAVQNDDLVEVLDALVDSLYVIFGTINESGLQDLIIPAFELVHKNNMTKVVDGKVIRNADGKILKPAGFVPVDLTTLFK